MKKPSEEAMRIVNGSALSLQTQAYREETGRIIDAFAATARRTGVASGVQAGVAEGLEEGRREMRERAAREADIRQADRIADAIRAIPIDGAPAGIHEGCPYLAKPGTVCNKCRKYVPDGKEPDLAPGLHWAIENCMACGGDGKSRRGYKIICPHCAHARAKLKELGHG